MDTQNIIKEIQQNENQQDNLRDEIKRLRAISQQMRLEVGAYWGEKTYGLKIGDRISWVEKSWRGKTSTITIEITRFECYIRNPDDKEDMTPSIHGLRVTKDGTVGKNEDAWYESMKAPFEKLAS
jgi:hypothetical protein